MRRQLPWLLLALSLLFNLFFAAGYLQARARIEQVDAEARVQRQVAEELQLDEAQAQVFSRLRSSLREEAQLYDEGMVLARQELIEALDGPDPDLDHLRRLIRREAELQQQRRLAEAQRFSAFTSVLTPEQRRELSSRMHRGRCGPPPRQMIERFDANGDGELDDTERRHAREFIEVHRERMERRRRDVAQRFDANGDGRLDEGERGAMRRWMFEQEGGRRWRGGGRGAGTGAGTGAGRGADTGTGTGAGTGTGEDGGTDGAPGM